jgi:disulfide bond formation protein DsbB
MTNKQIIYMITLIWLFSILWSLYFSNFGDPVLNIMEWHFFSWKAFEPCNLCRWARVLSYPIFALWALSMIHDDHDNISKYILPFALGGTILTAYNVYIQWNPTVQSFFCDPSNPCTNIDVAYFGFITIPMLAFVAFVIISILSYMSIRKPSE